MTLCNPAILPDVRPLVKWQSDNTSYCRNFRLSSLSLSLFTIIHLYLSDFVSARTYPVLARNIEPRACLPVSHVGRSENSADQFQELLFIRYQVGDRIIIKHLKKC